MTTRQMPGRKITVAFTARQDDGSIGEPWAHDAWPGWQTKAEDNKNEYWSEDGYFLTPAELSTLLQSEREAAWNASQACTYVPVGPCHKTPGFAQYKTFEQWEKEKRGEGKS